MSSILVNRSSGRKVYLEAARIIAAYFVIFNHTGASGFLLYSQRPVGSGAFWVYLFVSIFCKLSVPLFFMISGALMLHRDNESLVTLWKNRIGRIALVIVLFPAVNYLPDMLFSPGRQDFRWLILDVLTGTLSGGKFWYGHLWFLYAYIAFLCSLPFLRALVKNLEDKYFWYLMGIVLVINGLIPSVEYLIAQNSILLSRTLMPQWLAQNIVVYPCIGYYLEHRLDIGMQKKRIPWLWVGVAAGVAVTCFLVSRNAAVAQSEEQLVSEDFHSMFVLIYCIAVYVTLKYLFTQYNIPAAIEKGILSAGKSTFGIYLIHIIVLESQPMMKFLRLMLDRGVNNLLACFIQCGTVFLICYAIIAVARRMPVLKKLL